jgi:hypothetical protein
MFKDNTFMDAIHPDEHTRFEGGYTIPLYTHPAKTLTEDTECQYCKQGCIRCDPRKLLTDKEIEGIARANVDGHTSMEQLKWFARAILRKAQEK